MERSNMTLIDQIIDALASFRIRHGASPKRVKMNRRTYDKLKANAVTYPTEATGSMICGVEIEVDNSLVDDKVVPS